MANQDIYNVWRMGDFTLASTIRDVAALAGVSIGTVSKYINGGSIKDVNRVRIEVAINELNFRPNNIAKGLRNSKSFAVAILVPMISSSFASVMISAIEGYLLSFGYCVIISECHDDAKMEMQKIKFLAGRMVDGIVLLPFSESGKQIELLESTGIPFITIDQIIPSHKTDSVILDNANATYMPTKKLIELGHSKISLIAGNPALFTSQKRIDGYKEALSENDITFSPELLLNGNYTMEGAYRAVSAMFETKNLPTAIVVSNYDMTLGTLLALNHHRVRIPQDISVFGFDNLPLSKIIVPPLSTVTQPMVEMGRSAARLLLKRMRGDLDSVPEIIVHKASMLLSKSIAVRG